MIEQPADDGGLDEQTIAAFAAHLDAYAAGLSERERQALMTLLLQAMDPIERMGWREAADLLLPSEEAVLRALLAEEAQG